MEQALCCCPLLIRPFRVQLSESQCLGQPQLPCCTASQELGRCSPLCPPSLLEPGHMLALAGPTPSRAHTPGLGGWRCCLGSGLLPACPVPALLPWEGLPLLKMCLKLSAVWTTLTVLLPCCWPCLLPPAEGLLCPGHLQSSAAALLQAPSPPCFPPSQTSTTGPGRPVGAVSELEGP